MKTMLRLAETGRRFRWWTTRSDRPPIPLTLARLLCDMIVTEKYGVYHATNEESAPGRICRGRLCGRGMQIRVKRIASAEYPAKAARPMNSRLDKEKLTENGFERLPDWQDALKRYLKEIL